MAKVNRRDFGMRQSSYTGPRHEELAADSLGGQESALVKIEGARIGIVNKWGRRRGVLEVSVVGLRSETDDAPRVYAFWLSLECIQTLVEKLGDETDDWNGQLVPIVLARVENPSTGGFVDKYRVAHLDDFDALVEELTDAMGEGTAALSFPWFAEEAERVGMQAEAPAPEKKKRGRS